ncbi:MAG: TraB/GumN family protein [Acidobacteriota bacterium]|nr:TraB/GumN family protein [Acidobacteriota bacterium]
MAGRINRAVHLGLGGVLALAVMAGMAGAQEPAKHFLWKVTASTGAEAYLLGSVHVLTPAFYPLDPSIDRAFASSKVLVEEVDLDEMTNPATMMGLVAKAMLPDGQTLDQVVAKDTFEAVRARAESHGVPLMLLQRMKPWMAAVTLTTAVLTRAGFDSSLGIDKHFFDRAKAADMPRRALETVTYQFDRLDGLGATMQEASLKAMLADIEVQAGNIEVMAGAWKRGDAATLERLLHEGFTDAPELAERLLYERNRNWVPHVERCLNEDARCFVVVGAAHLVGPGSLVELLRERKLSVVQQ